MRPALLLDSPHWQVHTGGPFHRSKPTLMPTVLKARAVSERSSLKREWTRSRKRLEALGRWREIETGAEPRVVSLGAADSDSETGTRKLDLSGFPV